MLVPVIMNLLIDNLMAKKVDNPKDFLVIEVSTVELFAKAGGYGICDSCNATAENGYYVAVLNRWYCPACYESWVKRAKLYKEDVKFEKENFERYAKIFGL